MTWRILRFPVFGELGEIHVRMGFLLFVKKVLQYRFGIDANAFLSKSTIEEVDIARVNAETVVHQSELMHARVVKTIDR